MPKDSNPAAASNNRHHTHSHVYRTQAELLEELLGRGDGDPDMNGYPNEPKTT